MWVTSGLLSGSSGSISVTHFQPWVLPVTNKHFETELVTVNVHLLATYLGYYVSSYS